MSEIKFNNLELRKDIRAIVPNIDDLQLDLIEISVIHLVDVYVKAKFNQQQEIEKLTRIAAEADEGCEYWKERYKQAQAKAERCEKALRKIIDESICRGEDCTWGDTCCAVIARKALDNDEGRNENMRKVRFTLSMNLVGCKREEVMEFDDDMTDEEIQEQYEQWREEQLDGGWEEID